MAGLLQAYGGKRVAALLAMEDGLEWNSLTPEEKEFYYSKAYQKEQDKKRTQPPKDKSGNKRK